MGPWHTAAFVQSVHKDIRQDGGRYERTKHQQSDTCKEYTPPPVGVVQQISTQAQAAEGYEMYNTDTCGQLQPLKSATYGKTQGLDNTHYHRKTQASLY
jgi:hypothetical protein